MYTDTDILKALANHIYSKKKTFDEKVNNIKIGLNKKNFIICMHEEVPF